MPFGIEFDIDVDEYESTPNEMSAERIGLISSHEVAGDEATSARSHETPTPTVTHTEEGFKSHPQSYENLFKLTNRLRQEDRKRWLDRYASIRIQNTQHKVPLDALANDVVAMPPEPRDAQGATGSSEPIRTAAAPKGRIRLATHADKPEPSSPVSGAVPAMPVTVPENPASKSVSAGDMERDADTNDTNSRDGADIGGAPCRSVEQGTSVLPVLSAFSVAFAVLALLLAFVPVVGIYALMLPGAISVMVATVGIMGAHGRRQPIAMPVVAVALVLASMVVAMGVGLLYEKIGIIQVTQRSSGTVVSVSWDAD